MDSVNDIETGFAGLRQRRNPLECNDLNQVVKVAID